MLYHKWEYTAKSDEVAIVQPDGCCDVILISHADGPTKIKVTEWDMQPYTVQVLAGTSFSGYRLRPGASLPPQIFTHEELKKAEVEDVIKSETNADPEIFDIIDALTQPNATVNNIARQTGVTTRTLQRHFSHFSLPVPDFWRLLGRARRSARALAISAPLKDIAYAYGYSDQAHMTREFVRWFGCSPTQLRENKAMVCDICQPGLGGWLNDNHSEIRHLF